MFTVVVVTGTRAEYGLLRPVLQKLALSRAISPRLLVTGAHLSREYGYTVTEIEADASLGIAIDERLDILSQPVGEGRPATARRVGLCLAGCTAYFEKTNPDAVLLLGDRYEVFAAAQAAALLGIPVAHISGGDVTSGADDEWFRHCITKLAALHFPSCEEYRARVIRMGEEPGRVFNVGGLGDENIRALPLLGYEELQKDLGFALPRPYALVTFHPETQSGQSPEEQADALLAAMRANPQLFYLCTKANADAGGEIINNRLESFCRENGNAVLVASLGVLRYLSAMKHAALVLGNSSSGVVETPSFGTPCVNIGNRQSGRLISENILCCPAEAAAVGAALQTVLTPAFTQKASAAKSPYNGGDTSGEIVSVLEQFLASGKIYAPKVFYDGPFNNV